MRRMKSARDYVLRFDIRKQFIFLAALAAGAMLISGPFNVSAPHTSAEVRFTDPSMRGLAIVPASCDSIPPNPHIGGECVTTVTCSLTASESVVKAGESFTLTWGVGRQGTVADVMSEYHTFQGQIAPTVGSVSGSGNKQLGGTETVTIPATHRDGVVTYVLSGLSYFYYGFPPTELYRREVRNCSVDVMIQTAPAPNCEISAAPSPSAPGAEFTFTYTTRRADTASISSIGTVPVGKNKTLRKNAPTESKTYTMTVTGNGKTGSCSTDLLVDDGTTPACSIAAVPSTTRQGNPFDFVYTTLNAATASIADVGSDLATSTAGESRKKGWIAPQVSRTYTMTVGDGAGKTSTCDAAIAVVTPAPTCTLGVSPNPVAPGNPFTFGYTSRNADVGSIDHGVGNLTGMPNGNVGWNAPSATTTYNMTVRNIASGRQGTCSAQLDVASMCTPGCVDGTRYACINGNLVAVGPCNSSPFIKLTVSPTLVRKLDKTWISWDVDNVTSCTVKDDKGIDSWGPFGDSIGPPRESAEITGRTVYTLACIDLDGDPYTPITKVVNIIPEFEEQ